MKLRVRLVLALLALTTVGLAIFGVTTYVFYSRSQYDSLDDAIRASVPVVDAALVQQTHGGGLPEHEGPQEGGPRGTPPVIVPAGTYGELQSSTGAVLATVQLSSSTSDQPNIPDNLQPSDTLFNTGSVNGSTEWRVLAKRQQEGTGTVIVASPLTDIANSLHRLVLIEVLAASGLLLVLGGGSWLILRRGLRPLEQMATTAGTITAGDLSQRVEVTDERTEVGQLGVALNTMLAEIEAAFTERDATEQRLRQFLGDAAHELRTPLTSIQGFAELFRMGNDVEHVDLPVILRRIEEETARMRVLVDELLLLAQLDESRPVEREPVDLAVLAADACSDAAATVPGRAITLDAPSPVEVLGDRDHLRQAIGNLVANAVKHTADGTAIDVAVHADDSRTATVVVRDHGAGLDPDALDHVFDRFWQADPSRVGAGAGLGLAIAAGIAQEHGGEATAANADDGQGGAVFMLRLPL
jgi:two-component system OmpR family sensor kinase